MSDKRSQSEKFRRQKKNFFKRGTRIHQRCDAKIAIFVVRNGKLFLFDSSPDEDWLPGRDGWAARYELAERRSPADFTLDGQMASFTRQEPPKIDWIGQADRDNDDGGDGNAILVPGETSDGFDSAPTLTDGVDELDGLWRLINANWKRPRIDG